MTPLGNVVVEASSRGRAHPLPEAVAEITLDACRVDVSPVSRCDMLDNDEEAVLRREVKMVDRIEGLEGGGKEDKRVWSFSSGVRL